MISLSLWVRHLGAGLFRLRVSPGIPLKVLAVGCWHLRTGLGWRVVSKVAGWHAGRWVLAVGRRPQLLECPHRMAAGFPGTGAAMSFMTLPQKPSCHFGDTPYVANASPMQCGRVWHRVRIPGGRIIGGHLRGWVPYYMLPSCMEYRCWLLKNPKQRQHFHTVKWAPDSDSRNFFGVHSFIINIGLKGFCSLIMWTLERISINMDSNGGQILDELNILNIHICFSAKEHFPTHWNLHYYTRKCNQIFPRVLWTILANYWNWRGGCGIPWFITSWLVWVKTPPHLLPELLRAESQFSCSIDSNSWVRGWCWSLH